MGRGYLGAQIRLAGLRSVRHRRGRRAARQAEIRMRNRLKVLRAERDWTQADLARALDVSRQAVNAIETGKYDPSLPLAFAIARLFGSSVEDIFLMDDLNEKENES